MKRILIATDFSNSAHNAALYGADMAMAINAEIFLLHAYQLPLPTSEISAFVTEEDILDMAEEQMKKLVTEIKTRCSGSINVSVEIRLGSFYKELEMVCEAIKPYAVILGSKGVTAAERIFLGSQAVYTMKHLTWPVITVPPASTFATIKKMGLACDFDKIEDSIRIDEIKRLVYDFKAELYVLNTGSKRAFNPDIVFESDILRQKLKELNPRYYFITNENVDDGILEFAEENNIDLLIVSPKRHTLAEKLFHKSHTKQFVLHSHIPVMALHA